MGGTGDYHITNNNCTNMRKRINNMQKRILVPIAIFAGMIIAIICSIAISILWALRTLWGIIVRIIS